MTLKSLSNEEMQELSDAWISSEHGKKLLSKYKAFAGLTTGLEEAHAELVESQKRDIPPDLEKELKALQDKESALDLEHDRKGRGFYSLLGVIADLAEDQHIRDQALDTRDELFPEGLGVLNRTYTEEAGFAQKLNEQLTPTTKHFLAGIKVNVEGFEYHLDQILRSMIHIASDLGKLEQEKHTLEAKIDEVTKVPYGKKLVHARNRWIRAVNAILTAAELEDPIPSDIKKAIIDPVNKAIKRAERNAKKSTVKQ